PRLDPAGLGVEVTGQRLDLARPEADMFFRIRSCDRCKWVTSAATARSGSWAVHASRIAWCSRMLAGSELRRGPANRYRSLFCQTGSSARSSHRDPDAW